MTTLGGWRKPRIGKRCIGCVRAQECKHTYFRADGTCPYKVEAEQYAAWLDRETPNDRGARIVREGS